MNGFPEDSIAGGARLSAAAQGNPSDISTNFHVTRGREDFHNTDPRQLASSFTRVKGKEWGSEPWGWSESTEEKQEEVCRQTVSPARDEMERRRREGRKDGSGEVHSSTYYGLTNSSSFMEVPPGSMSFSPPPPVSMETSPSPASPLPPPPLLTPPPSSSSSIPPIFSSLHYSHHPLAMTTPFIIDAYYENLLQQLQHVYADLQEFVSLVCRNEQSVRIALKRLEELHVVFQLPFPPHARCPRMDHIFPRRYRAYCQAVRFATENPKSFERVANVKILRPLQELIVVVQYLIDQQLQRKNPSPPSPSKEEEERGRESSGDGGRRKTPHASPPTPILSSATCFSTSMSPEMSIHGGRSFTDTQQCGSFRRSVDTNRKEPSGREGIDATRARSPHPSLCASFPVAATTTDPVPSAASLSPSIPPSSCCSPPSLSHAHPITAIPTPNSGSKPRRHDPLDPAGYTTTTTEGGGGAAPCAAEAEEGASVGKGSRVDPSSRGGGVSVPLQDLTTASFVPVCSAVFPTSSHGSPFLPPHPPPVPSSSCLPFPSAPAGMSTTLHGATPAAASMSTVGSHGGSVGEGGGGHTTPLPSHWTGQATLASSCRRPAGGPSSLCPPPEGPSGGGGSAASPSPSCSSLLGISQPTSVPEVAQLVHKSIEKIIQRFVRLQVAQCTHVMTLWLTCRILPPHPASTVATSSFPRGTGGRGGGGGSSSCAWKRTTSGSGRATGNTCTRTTPTGTRGNATPTSSASFDPSLTSYTFSSRSLSGGVRGRGGEGGTHHGKGRYLRRVRGHDPTAAMGIPHTDAREADTGEVNTQEGNGNDEEGEKDVVHHSPTSSVTSRTATSVEELRGGDPFMGSGAVLRHPTGMAMGDRSGCHSSGTMVTKSSSSCSSHPKTAGDLLFSSSLQKKESFSVTGRSSMEMGLRASIIAPDTSKPEGSEKDSHHSPRSHTGGGGGRVCSEAEASHGVTPLPLTSSLSSLSLTKNSSTVANTMACADSKGGKRYSSGASSMLDSRGVGPMDRDHLMIPTSPKQVATGEDQLGVESQGFSQTTPSSPLCMELVGPASSVHGPEGNVASASGEEEAMPAVAELPPTSPSSTTASTTTAGMAGGPLSFLRAFQSEVEALRNQTGGTGGRRGRRRGKVLLEETAEVEGGSLAGNQPSTGVEGEHSEAVWKARRALGNAIPGIVSSPSGCGGGSCLTPTTPPTPSFFSSESQRWVVRPSTVVEFQSSTTSGNLSVLTTGDGDRRNSSTATSLHPQGGDDEGKEKDRVLSQKMTPPSSSSSPLPVELPTAMLAQFSPPPPLPPSVSAFVSPVSPSTSLSFTITTTSSSFSSAGPALARPFAFSNTIYCPPSRQVSGVLTNRSQTKRPTESLTDSPQGDVHSTSLASSSPVSQMEEEERMRGKRHYPIPHSDGTGSGSSGTISSSSPSTMPPPPPPMSPTPSLAFLRHGVLYAPPSPALCAASASHPPRQPPPPGGTASEPSAVVGSPAVAPRGGPTEVGVSSAAVSIPSRPHTSPMMAHFIPVASPSSSVHGKHPATRTTSISHRRSSSKAYPPLSSYSVVPASTGERSSGADPHFHLHSITWAAPSSPSHHPSTHAPLLCPAPPSGPQGSARRSDTMTPFNNNSSNSSSHSSLNEASFRVTKESKRKGTASAIASLQKIKALMKKKRHTTSQHVISQENTLSSFSSFLSAAPLASDRKENLHRVAEVDPMHHGSSTTNASLGMPSTAESVSLKDLPPPVPSSHGTTSNSPVPAMSNASPTLELRKSTTGANIIFTSTTTPPPMATPTTTTPTMETSPSSSVLHSSQSAAGVRWSRSFSGGSSTRPQPQGKMHPDPPPPPPRSTVLFPSSTMNSLTSCEYRGESERRKGRRQRRRGRGGKASKPFWWSPELVIQRLRQAMGASSLDFDRLIHVCSCAVSSMLQLTKDIVHSHVEEMRPTMNLMKEIHSRLSHFVYVQYSWIFFDVHRLLMKPLERVGEHRTFFSLVKKKWRKALRNRDRRARKRRKMMIKLSELGKEEEGGKETTILHEYRTGEQSTLDTLHRSLSTLPSGSRSPGRHRQKSEGRKQQTTPTFTAATGPLPKEIPKRKDNEEETAKRAGKATTPDAAPPPGNPSPTEGEPSPFSLPHYVSTAQAGAEGSSGFSRSGQPSVAENSREVIPRSSIKGESSRTNTKTSTMHAMTGREKGGAGGKEHTGGPETGKAPPLPPSPSGKACLVSYQKTPGGAGGGGGGSRQQGNLHPPEANRERSLSGGKGKPAISRTSSRSTSKRRAESLTPSSPEAGGHRRRHPPHRRDNYLSTSSPSIPSSPSYSSATLSSDSSTTTSSSASDSGTGSSDGGKKFFSSPFASIIKTVYDPPPLKVDGVFIDVVAVPRALSNKPAEPKHPPQSHSTSTATNQTPVHLNGVSTSMELSTNERPPSGDARNLNNVFGGSIRKIRLLPPSSTSHRPWAESTPGSHTTTMSNSSTTVFKALTAAHSMTGTPPRSVPALALTPRNIPQEGEDGGGGGNLGGPYSPYTFSLLGDSSTTSVIPGGTLVTSGTRSSTKSSSTSTWGTAGISHSQFSFLRDLPVLLEQPAIPTPQEDQRYICYVEPNGGWSPLRSRNNFIAAFYASRIEIDESSSVSTPLKGKRGENGRDPRSTDSHNRSGKKGKSSMATRGTTKDYLSDFFSRKGEESHEKKVSNSNRRDRGVSMGTTSQKDGGDRGARRGASQQPGRGGTTPPMSPVRNAREMQAHQTMEGRELPHSKLEASCKENGDHHKGTEREDEEGDKESTKKKSACSASGLQDLLDSTEDGQAVRKEIESLTHFLPAICVKYLHALGKCFFVDEVRGMRQRGVRGLPPALLSSATAGATAMRRRG